MGREPNLTPGTPASSVKKTSPPDSRPSLSLIGSDRRDFPPKLQPEIVKAEGIRPRVLIADDREENRYVLCRVLEAAGYDCATASTGRGVLEIVPTLPDVVIL